MSLEASWFTSAEMAAFNLALAGPSCLIRAMMAVNRLGEPRSFGLVDLVIVR